MREIKRIILHCSDSDFGDADTIDFWHKQRGWKGIGYHYVILNGYRFKNAVFSLKESGLRENGRPLEMEGAHVKGHNADSVGICLIGKHTFTADQLLMELPTLLHKLMAQFNLSYKDIYGHYELDGKKDCPNIDMNLIRYMMRKI